MKRLHWALAMLGLLIVLLGIMQLMAPYRGLEIIEADTDGLPITVMVSQGVPANARPLILIGHGFSLSRIVMRGYGLTLAHAGYTVVLWDFDGHGQNGHKFFSIDTLLSNAESAWHEALSHGWGDSERIAIIGHSMGSGVALRFAQKYALTSATVAISPTVTPVSPVLPRNLLLLAGAAEPIFLSNAERALAQAGGAGGSMSAGSARLLKVIEHVEHITILFSPVAQQAVREWLDRSFGPQEGARTYIDWRLVWFGVTTMGLLLVMLSLSPLLDSPGGAASIRPLVWRFGALLGSGLASTLLLWCLGIVGLELDNLLCLQVGGYLLVWFGLAGSIALLILWRWPPGFLSAAMLPTFAAVVVVVLGVGLLVQLLLMPWLLITPQRLVILPFATLLAMPWFLAVGEVQCTADPWTRIAWSMVHGVILFGFFYLAIKLSPELRFFALILPFFAGFIVLHGLFTARLSGIWPFVVSGSLFTSWLVVASFPL